MTDTLANVLLKHYISGDGVIDQEEFEYVLSEFGVRERTARQAFTIVTQVRKVTLFSQAYQSDSEIHSFVEAVRTEMPL